MSQQTKTLLKETVSLSIAYVATSAVTLLLALSWV